MPDCSSKSQLSHYSTLSSKKQSTHYVFPPRSFQFPSWESPGHIPTKSQSLLKLVKSLSHERTVVGGACLIFIHVPWENVMKNKDFYLLSPDQYLMKFLVWCTVINHMFEFNSSDTQINSSSVHVLLQNSQQQYLWGILLTL